MSVFKELETAALVDDLPQFDLRAGDMGVVLLVHQEDAYSVEFTAPGGYSCALLTLRGEWLRKPTEDDLANRRPLEPHEFIDVVTSHPKPKARSP
jgi:hypothetical protein